MHSIPTTKNLRIQIEEKFTSKLNENVPLLVFAFLKILSAILAIIVTPIYKYIDSCKKQSLALTADEENLEEIGLNYGTPREPAATAELEVEITITENDVTLPKSAVYKTDNDLYYFPSQTYLFDDFVGPDPETRDVILAGENPGTEYNLSVDDELTMEYEIAGIVNTATVTGTSSYGADKEPLEGYRRHVLSEIGTVGGGGNNVDYRRWGEAVDGVYRVFPYPGRPDDPDNAIPGEISVFVETEAILGTDGVPSSTLLDNVKTALQYDPDTGKTRPPIVDVEDKLRVLSIDRVYFKFTISDSIIDSGILGQAQTSVESAIDEHLRSIGPYVVGIDREYERSDKVSPTSISKVVSEILKSYGGEAGTVTMDVVSEGTNVPMRQLTGGQIARLYDGENPITWE